MTIEALRHLLNGGVLKHGVDEFVLFDPYSIVIEPYVKIIYFAKTEKEKHAKITFYEWIMLYKNSVLDIIPVFNLDSLEYKYEKLKAAYDDLQKQADYYKQQCHKMVQQRTVLSAMGKTISAPQYCDICRCESILIPFYSIDAKQGKVNKKLLLCKSCYEYFNKYSDMVLKAIFEFEETLNRVFPADPPPKKHKVKAWIYLVWYEYRNFPNDSLLQKTIECKAYTKDLSKSIISEWISEIYKQHKDSHIAQVDIINWKLLRKEYESE